jgi:hypothetical protein
MIVVPGKLKLIDNNTLLDPSTIQGIIATTSENIAGLLLKLQEGCDNVVSIVNCTDKELRLIRHSQDHNNGKFVEAPPPIIYGKTVGMFSSSKSKYSVIGNKNYVLYSIKGSQGYETEVLLYWHLPSVGDDTYWFAIAPGGTYENKPDKDIIHTAHKHEEKDNIHCLDPSGDFGFCSFLRVGRIECALMTAAQAWWKERAYA